MRPYSQDSIAAIATPRGIGALAIIRVSGNALSPLYKKLTNKHPQNRYALFSKIYHPITGFVIDEGVIIYFKSPHSFTGEDIIEITCHGGISTQTSILNSLIEAGLRQASPGEFSLRSYLNGKIDLVQAEAVSSLISSSCEIESNISLNNNKSCVKLFIVWIRVS